MMGSRDAKRRPGECYLLRPKHTLIPWGRQNLCSRTTLTQEVYTAKQPGLGLGLRLGLGVTCWVGGSGEHTSGKGPFSTQPGPKANRGQSPGGLESRRLCVARANMMGLLRPMDRLQGPRGNPFIGEVGGWKGFLTPPPSATFGSKSISKFAQKLWESKRKFLAAKNRTLGTLYFPVYIYIHACNHLYIPIILCLSRSIAIFREHFPFLSRSIDIFRDHFPFLGLKKKSQHAYILKMK